MPCTLTSTLKSAACIKIVVQIWMKADVKREMLSVNHNTRVKWKNVLKMIKDRVDELMLPELQVQDLKGIIRPIGKQLMKWLMFHKTIFHTAERSAADFFSFLCWTPQGTIDKKKTARRLIETPELLNVREKYTLACVYCLEDHIRSLQSSFATERDLRKTREKLRSMFALKKYWDDVLRDEANEIPERISAHEYAFTEAAKSGNDVALAYFWKKLENKLSPQNKVILLLQALEEAELKISRVHHPKYVAFPLEYYDDVVCFLISCIISERCTDVLKNKFDNLTYFLDAPWQYLFVKVASYMWSTLLPTDFSFLLSKIFDKMINEGDYDYQKLFEDFWRQSPVTQRKQLLSTKSGRFIVSKLFGIKDLSYKDMQNIEMMIDDAATEDKMKIIYDDNCIFTLIEMGRLRLLEILIKKCVPSDEKFKLFKKELAFSQPGKNTCVILMKNNKCDSVDSFLNWCELPEKDITQFKKELII